MLSAINNYSKIMREYSGGRENDLIKYEHLNASILAIRRELMQYNEYHKEEYLSINNINSVMY